MARVVPLTLRFVRSDLTGEVPSPPHDALSPAARKRFIQDHPRSYLGVTRAPEDSDGSTEDVLDAGRRFLLGLLEDGVFEAPLGPTYFVYRLEQGSHQQTGLICGVATADYESGTVKIHEQIRQERAAHLAKHLRVVGAQSSPIALAYADRPHVTQAMARTTERFPPLLDFSDDSGLRQQLWQISDPEDRAAIDGSFDGLALYLIDGHHRAAAASTYHRSRGTQSDGEHLMLATLFPYEELRSYAFHRFLTGIDPVAIEAEIAERFATRTTTELGEVAARSESELALALPGESGEDPSRWVLIDVPLDPNDTVGLSNIDPMRLSNNILKPLLGIDESGSDHRLSYRPGTGDLNEIATVRPDRGEAVFVMRAIDTATLLAVSDAGLVMPPKSTYFQPKVRSGLFIRLID